MKAYRLSSQMPIEGIPGSMLGLAQQTSEDLQPGPGEVLMRVQATSLNYVDLVTLTGAFGNAGIVPLLDGAGEVAAVGPGVTRWRVGDRIIPSAQQNWPAGKLTPESYGVVLGGLTDGMLRQQAVLPENGVVAIPEHLSFEEAATLPCAGLTAWSSLVRHGPLLPGNTVLVLGTGGVSVFALQLAKCFGARVIATTSTAAKMKQLERLGADAVINYVDTPEWSGKVRELTAERGVDLVVEVGGSGTLPQSIRSLRVGGRLALIGIVAGAGDVPFMELLPIIQQAHTVYGVSIGSCADLRDLTRAVALHTLHPVVDKVFPFERAADAYRYFASRAHVGKVVITV
jgi:NADPH:quinone reductase-like Zn-dependent oxidoreductase